MTKSLLKEVTTTESVEIGQKLPIPKLTSTPARGESSKSSTPLLDRARRIRAKASPSPNRFNKSLVRRNAVSSPIPRVEGVKSFKKLDIKQKRAGFKKFKHPVIGRDEYLELIRQFSSRQEKPTSSTPTVTIDLTEDDSVLEKLKPTPVDLVKEKLSVISIVDEKSKKSTKIAHNAAVASSRREADREIAELEKHLHKLSTDTKLRCGRVKQKYGDDVEDIRKTLPKVTELPPLPEELSDEIRAKVNNIWSSGSAGQVVGQFERNECTRGDLRTLRGAEWLNDEVMNFYYQLIAGRSKNNESLPKTHAFNTFFYAKLKQQGHGGVKRWTRKVDIFSFDRVVIPIHLGVHWTCAAFLMNEKRIIYLDSMGGSNAECRQILLGYLEKEHKLSMKAFKRKGSDLPEGWEHESLSDRIPQQDNMSDCGVFSCTFSNYIALGFDKPEQFNFGPRHMQNYRRLMCYHITQGSLPDPE